MPATVKAPAKPRAARIPRFSSLSENVMSFSQVRNNLAGCIRRTRETHLPIIITQNGRATSVLADLRDLDAWIEEQEIREAVRIGDEQIARGEGIPHEQVVREMEALFKTFPEKP